MKPKLSQLQRINLRVATRGVPSELVSHHVNGHQHPSFSAVRYTLSSRSNRSP